MNNKQKQDTIQKRQDKNKELVIKQLKKTPIVQIACEKIGISRATYYRWRKEEKDFAENTDNALMEGYLFINDLAESQVLRDIQDRKFNAVVFWLKHHHIKYGNKIEIIASRKEDKLTPEQEAVFDKAIQLANLNPYDESRDKKDS